MKRSVAGLLALSSALAIAALVSARQSATVERDIVYFKSGGAAFTMDAYRPAKPNGMAVLFVVSGGWFSDHKDINPGLGKAFNDRGITLFQVVPGSQPRYKIPEMEVMVSQSVRYVRANAARFAISPRRIGVLGASAGGHLALMSGVLANLGKADAVDPVERVSSRPDAIAAFCPPTDLASFGAPGRAPWSEEKYKVFLPAFPVPPSDAAAFAKSVREISPIGYVSPAFPPTLLIHGDKDDLVPLQQSRSMDAALAKAGVIHKLVVVPGEGHGGGLFAAGAETMFAWFEERLK